MDRMARRHSAATVQAAPVARLARRAVAAVPVLAARADAVSQALTERMERMVRALRRAAVARAPVATRWRAWAEPVVAVTPWAASLAAARQAPVAGVGRAAEEREPVAKTIL